VKSVDQIAKHFYIFSFLLFCTACILSIAQKHHAIDIQLHDTYFVIASSHILFVLSILMAVIATLYLLVPKLLGRTLNILVGKIHFWISALCILLLSVSSNFIGMGSVPRRYYRFENTFDTYNHLDKVLILVSISILVFLLAQLLPILNLLIFSSEDQNKKRQDNPLK